MSEVLIRPLERGDEKAFRRLNKEWIGRSFSIEEKDRAVLGDPLGEPLYPAPCQRSVVGLERGL